MKKFLKAVYFEFEGAICAVMFAIMLVILFMQVILRFVFHAPNVWSEELARYLFIYIVYLASSYAVLERRHIRIDGLEKVFPGILRPITAILGDLIWIGFSAFLCVTSAIYVKENVYALHTVSLGLKMEMWPWWMALPIGNGLITIRMIIYFIENWFIKRSLIPRDEDPNANNDDLPEGVGE